MGRDAPLAAMAARPGEAVVEQAGEVRLARVESLRALAALAVLVGHAFAWSHDYRWEETTDTIVDRALLGGGFGVYLFFALSGYLLYLPFARRDFGDGVVDLPRYALNRGLRIVPLYWVSVAVLLVVQEGGGSGEQWWRFLLFAQQFSAETEGTVNPLLWSLVVEVHFYVALPALAWLIARAAAGSLATAAVFVAALAAASFALYAIDPPLALGGPGNSRGSFPALLFFFAGGMLVALLRLDWDALSVPGWARRASVWLAASLPLWVAIAASYDLAPLAALSSALVVAACVLPLVPGRLGRALSWRPLALLGVASYSLYVWHLQIIEEIRFDWGTFGGFPGLLAVSLAVCVPVAFLSYALVEAPALRLRRRWALRDSRSGPVPPADQGMHPTPRD